VNKSKIEWTDYTLNPVKGLCPMACSYCYARRMYKRFHWDETIREDVSVYDQLDKMNAGSKVFVGSTMELFGEWVTPLMRSNIFHVVEMYPDLTFIFLTKQPQNLPSKFPDNCWVGVSIPRAYDDTVVGHFEAFKRISALGQVSTTVKFISFEPLLESIASEFSFGLETPLNAYGITWLIIGQQTPSSPKTRPQMSWIQDILVAAHNAGDIPVFMKNNLQPLLTGAWSGWKLRQEFPRLTDK
jgi:protein gp37